MSVEELLQTARSRVEVGMDEIREARKRRTLISEALLSAFPRSSVYVNGSLAHGDAKSPLSDIDLGVVMAGAEHTYGPGLEGPRVPMDLARDAIRTHLLPHYPKLRVQVEGKRRAVEVRFGEPVSSTAEDFTADVIVAVDRPQPGLHIPNLPKNSWDPAHPIRHTELVHETNARTANTFARSVRLLKFWNEEHGSPICSWNIKVLAMQCLIEPTPISVSLSTFFGHAVKELEQGETEDPARVAGPIKINMAKLDVVARMRSGKERMDAALLAESEGRPVAAQYHLGLLLPGLVDEVSRTALETEESTRVRNSKVLGRSTGVGVAAATVIPAVRAWRDPN